MRALDSLANGNLNAEVDRRALKRRDEIGKLMRAVLNLRGQMKEVIGAIIEKGDAVQLAAIVDCAILLYFVEYKK